MPVVLIVPVAVTAGEIRCMMTMGGFSSKVPVAERSVVGSVGEGLGLPQVESSGKSVKTRDSGTRVPTSQNFDNVSMRVELPRTTTTKKKKKAKWRWWWWWWWWWWW